MRSSESFVGLTVAATRQKVGSALKSGGGTPGGPKGPGGGTNAPADTVCVSVIVVLGNCNDARPSHGAVAKALPHTPSRVTIAMMIWCRDMISPGSSCAVKLLEARLPCGTSNVRYGAAGPNQVVSASTSP